MIIGKAIYAGGAGGLKPEIIVTAEAGSTLTCGTKTYILGASETTHTFTVALGTYIVTATKGSDSATKTVLVDMVAQYDVSLTYGTPLADFAVGSVVKLKVNGSLKDFIVVHQGKPSSIYSTTFENGTILLMQDIYENREWHSTSINDYANGTLHSYMNNGFLALFDANIRSVIKQVKVPYRKGSGAGTTVTSGENGLSAKIFLLSGAEVGFTSSDASYLPTNEGAKLSYFESGTRTTSAKNKRIAKLNGTATFWWLRSPSCASDGGTCGVKADGTADYDYGLYSRGVRPALVLPDTTLVDDNGMITV